MGWAYPSHCSLLSFFQDLVVIEVLVERAISMGIRSPLLVMILFLLVCLTKHCIKYFLVSNSSPLFSAYISG